MPTATAEAPARAALLGNPSDGYGGRTIALALANFAASATVSLGAPTSGRRQAEPLVDAAVARFALHCASIGGPLLGPPVAIDFATTIPRSVGLAGSSAIVIAVLRALSASYAVPLAPETLAGLALEAETEELGIAAGPQDRVVQANGGLLDMDFARGTVDRLDPELLPPLYLAYQAGAAQSSGAVHGDLRARFERGERAVVGAMAELAHIAAEGREALERRDPARLAALVDRNFDVRRSILELDPRHVRMVELARSLGASAHFPGSGGAVLGIHEGPEQLRSLREAFTAEGCVVVEPSVAPGSRGSAPLPSPR
ncbi:MAG: mevalonate kinase family protein [Solirubrobacteraceae bacterium]